MSRVQEFLLICRDVSQLHEEQRKLIRKSGGAAIGFYPDDGSGKTGMNL